MAPVRASTKMRSSFWSKRTHRAKTRRAPAGRGRSTSSVSPTARAPQGEAAPAPPPPRPPRRCGLPGAEGRGGVGGQALEEPAVAAECPPLPVDLADELCPEDARPP